jgi:hypothetical protein
MVNGRGVMKEGYLKRVNGRKRGNGRGVIEEG